MNVAHVGDRGSFFGDSISTCSSRPLSDGLHCAADHELRLLAKASSSSCGAHRQGSDPEPGSGDLTTAMRALQLAGQQGGPLSSEQLHTLDQLVRTGSLDPSTVCHLQDVSSPEAFTSTRKASWSMYADHRLHAAWAAKGARSFSQAAERATLSGHKSLIRGIAMLPGPSPWAATASWDTTVRLWSVDPAEWGASTDEACLGVGQGHRAPAYCVAATACSWPHSKAASGVLLASGSEDETVRLWCLDGEEAAAAAAARRGSACSGASPRASSCAGGAGMLQLACCAELPVGSARAPLSLAFAPRGPCASGPLLMATGIGGVEDQVQVWALDPQQLHSTRGPQWVAGQHTSGGAAGGGAQDIAGNSAFGVRGLAFSPVDPSCLVASAVEGHLLVLDVVAQACSQLMPINCDVLGMALSEDGALAFLAGHDGTVACWDLRCAQRAALLTGHDNFVWSVAALGGSSGAVQLCSGSADCTARLHDLRRAGGGGSCACTCVMEHPDAVAAVAFCPPPGPHSSSGGEVGLVTGSDDCLVRVWALRP